MMFDLGMLSRRQGAKLLLSTVVPRPIAWVVTVDALGTPNAAPFSFFNALCSNPPMIGLGIGAREGADKDTARNIRLTRELVVNLVSASSAEAMNVSASDFGPQTDELSLLGLQTLPSHAVKPPRIAESPVALECAVTHVLDMSSDAAIVLAEVKIVHIADEFVIDPDQCYVDSPKMALLARMQGSTYGRVTDLFDMARLDPEAAAVRAQELLQKRAALASVDEPDLALSSRPLLGARI